MFDMTTTIFTSPHRAARDLLRDERGNITMEFVIVMPLFTFIIMGSLVFWDAFRSNSQAAKLSYTVSDIVSRHQDVDDVDMADLFGLQDKMMDPRLDRRTLRISSICFDDNTYKVLWSDVKNGNDVAGLAPLSDEDIPVGIMPTMAPQDSIILTEVEARWQPFFGNVGIGEKTWRSELVTRPRFVKIIPHETLNPATVCPINS